MVWTADAVAGALIGGAIGDALGACCEGRGPDPTRRLPESGRITDDTQLTLATCEALLQAGGVDLPTIAARYVAWYQSGRLHGLGSGTTKALRDLALGAHWALSGVRGEHAAGAGAAMRVAPVAFVLDPENASDRQTLRDFARITHHHEEAYAGALAVAVAIRGMLGPDSPRSVLERVVELTPDSVVRDRLAALSALPGDHFAEARAFAGTTGYVADVVPLALFGALKLYHKGLLQLLVEVLRMGGDTDTIGAILGTVVGARLGRHALACISHSSPTAAADLRGAARCAPFSPLDVVSTTPARSSGPRTAPHHVLDGLATDRYEKCMLANPLVHALSADDDLATTVTAFADFVASLPAANAGA